MVYENLDRVSGSSGSKARRNASGGSLMSRVESKSVDWFDWKWSSTASVSQ